VPRLVRSRPVEAGAVSEHGWVDRSCSRADPALKALTGCCSWPVRSASCLHVRRSRPKLGSLARAWTVSLW